jgi:hypothetical protein
MATTVDLTHQEIEDLKTLTNETDPAEAVRAATREFIRYARRMRLKELSGRVEMQETWRELEQSEVRADGNGSGTGAD